jgi:hypothetical protein
VNYTSHFHQFGLLVKCIARPYRSHACNCYGPQSKSTGIAKSALPRCINGPIVLLYTLDVGLPIMGWHDTLVGVEDE